MSDERPLRIHFLTHFVHEQGTYFRFHNLAVGLTQLGQEVTVFGCDNETGSKKRTEVRDGVTYEIVPVGKGTKYFTAFCHPGTAIYRGFLKYPKCDVVHLFQPFPNAALAWQRRMKKSSKVSFYDWDDLWNNKVNAKIPRNFTEGWFRMLAFPLEAWLPRKADAVTTCSQYLSELAYDRRAKRVEIIHNGIWPYEPAEKAKARAGFKLAPNAIYVGFMGRTTRELDWCIDALAEVMDLYPQLRLAVCGADPAELQGVSEAVKARIDFLGQLPSLETRNFAAALDLGLLPLEDNAFNRSRFPIKYAEYMAAGAPVLCSAIGECSILSKDLPWVIQAGTTKSEWLAAFRGAVQSCSENAVPEVNRDVIRARFSWHSLSKQLLRLYFSELAARDLGA